MSDLFSDRLLDAIADKGSPICVGIDPVYEMLPDAVAGPANRRNANDAPAAVDAIFDFTLNVLKTVAPLVPCVKFQSAYFEKYLWEGVEAYYSLIQEAKELGLVADGYDLADHRVVQPRLVRVLRRHLGRLRDDRRPTDAPDPPES